MKKDDRYAIRCNSEVKQSFMTFCKIGGVSPSDVLQAVMIEFNQMAESVLAIQDVTELRGILQDSINRVNEGVAEFEKSTDLGKYLP